MSEAVFPSERPSLSRVGTTEAAYDRTVVLLGNPNVGKTTLFNALTGESEKVGNYPGITVERRSARLHLPTIDGSVELVDVPGAYSLSARSAEEQVALDATIGLHGNPRPSLVVLVIDAGQLRRNLYLVLQLVEFASPAVIALTMMDEVKERPPNPKAVGALFRVPCVAVSGRTGEGLKELNATIANALRLKSNSGIEIPYGREIVEQVDRVAEVLPGEWRKNVEHDRAMALWALLSLSDDDELSAPEPVREVCRAVHEETSAAGRDFDLEVIGKRYAFIDDALGSLYDQPASQTVADPSEKWDRILLHPLYGTLVFVSVMLVVFQSLFSWTDPAITLIENGVSALRDIAVATLPASLLTDALTEGVIGGVGNVVVFLPQILLLFLFVGLLEDSGYMARVAYLMDRILRGVGLHGRAFVPMLSGLACAVPAILATRTMERRRDRLLTMMVVPLMTCSARLPVYALIIAALFPPSDVFGLLPVQGLLMVSMYLFSIVTTLFAAWVLGRTVVRGRGVPLLLELPRYRFPNLGTTLRMVWQRARTFLTEAGTTILAFTLILWVLLSFPKPPTTDESPDARASAQSAQSAPAQSEGTPAKDEDGAPTLAAAPNPTEPASAPAVSPLEASYGGRLGRALAPVMAPLGFDWKITVGIIGAFSAREVFVSTLGLVFGLDNADESPEPLRDKMRAETRADGRPAYSPLVGLSLMVFFALACQCMSTLAVVRRETQSWRWPLFMFGYMTVLAYLASLVVYQGGQLLGFAG